MFPILFRVGPAALFAYPVFLSLAFFVGLGVWIHESRRHQISAEKIVNLSLGAFLFGLLGARILYIITQWPSFWSGELRVWALWEGGLVYLGGFLAALAYLAWSLPRHGISCELGFNTAVPALAFAQAVGRLGCFANGCCHGGYCDWPWAVVYRNPLSVARPLETPLHPSQLYEAMGLCLLGMILLRLGRRPQTRWPAYSVYLIGYGILRFLVEFTRGDQLRGKFWIFSTSQWLSMGLILSAVMLDLLSRNGHKLPHESRNRKSQRPLQKTHD